MTLRLDDFAQYGGEAGVSDLDTGGAEVLGLQKEGRALKSIIS
jgi:hypothetical protein